MADGTRTEAWVAEAPSHCLEQTLRDLDRACRQHGVWRVHWRTQTERLQFTNKRAIGALCMVNEHVIRRASNNVRAAG
ncbi:MAG TPA: hypothetical protein VEO53_14460 [Candidatus Binatia bacterium]|nr:hypothetical protein [Candidatus Binatia bacterium]